MQFDSLTIMLSNIMFIFSTLNINIIILSTAVLFLCCSRPRTTRRHDGGLQSLLSLARAPFAISRVLRTHLRPQPLRRRLHQISAAWSLRSKEFNADLQTPSMLSFGASFRCITSSNRGRPGMSSSCRQSLEFRLSLCP